MYFSYRIKYRDVERQQTVTTWTTVSVSEDQKLLLNSAGVKVPLSASFLKHKHLFHDLPMTDKELDRCLAIAESGNPAPLPVKPEGAAPCPDVIPSQVNHYGVLYAECACCGFLICVSRRVGLHDGFGDSHLKCPACSLEGCTKQDRHQFLELTKMDFAKKCGLAILEPGASISQGTKLLKAKGAKCS